MLDYLAIFKKFNEQEIQYIVVGGIAVNLYGIPRMTYDIDLLIDMGDGNIKKLLGLLKKWGFKPRIPVAMMDFANKDKREEWIRDKNMKAFNLVNPEWAISEIDIVLNSPINYEQAYTRVNHVALHGVSIPVLSLDDLIKMKQETGREQDKSDILYLRSLKHEKKQKKRL